MIITKTPFRISFVGGGTDLSDFYTRETGAVVSSTIDKYIHLAIQKSFEPHFLLRYSKTEKATIIDEIEHPLIRESFKILKPKMFIELSSFADIPSSGSGLGSSSAFTVGLLKALLTLEHKIPDTEAIAEMASEIEIEKLHEPIGKQDQYASAVGGFNLIEFKPDHSVKVTPLNVSFANIRKLEEHSLLFYTGITRKAEIILTEQKNNTSHKESSFQKLKQMRDLAYEFAIALQEGNIVKMGQLLNKNWELKKGLANGISNPELEKYYNSAINAGALGGKILGAGGGGFYYFICAPKDQAKVISQVALRKVDFKFDSQGTRIIHIDNED